ncbi:MAG: DUF4202 domain-containing protein [Actinomycetes bacterium]
MTDARFDLAIAAIDAMNADDPNVIMVDGVERPKEQAHAELMTAWIWKLDSAPSDAQLLAARAHHLRRWSIPRDQFPDGRVGYLRWRTSLKAQHADEVASVLVEAGYDVDVIDHVQRIIRKEKIKTDDDTQTHEDALCLTFLQTQFVDLAERLGDDKTVDVVKKTLVKMSDKGRTEALALPLTAAEVILIDRALAAG